MVLGLVLGLCLSTVNILAQTTLQQESPADIRGRVFSVQFMLNNLIGIPPMLDLGGVADAVGIPRVAGNRRSWPLSIMAPWSAWPRATPQTPPATRPDLTLTACSHV